MHKLISTYLLFGLLSLGATTPVLAFTATYLDPGYTATSFATLPFDTRAIAFDNSMNLYTASSANDSSGYVNVVKFSAASGYSASNTAYSYATTAANVNGLDFYGNQLLVSEGDASGDSGKISDAATGASIKELASFRPTSIDARGAILFAGRLKSDPNFGNIYRLNPDNSLSVVIANIPLRGIVTDSSGNIFVSTRNSNYGTFLANSIYKFSTADSYNPASATRIVTLGGGGSTELSFDNVGNLYTLYAADPNAPTSAEIIRISSIAPPTPAPVSLVTGWNLLGNSANASLTVATATTLGDASKVATVWKWIPLTSKWAFYTPTQADGGAAYAAGKGYDVLTTISGGEGFWVNAKTAFTVQLPAGIPISSNMFSDQLTPPNSLPVGWSLIAIGDNKTPKAFATAISTTAPAAGSVPTSLTTLWAWDSGLSNWYFYAPSLDNSSGLASYIATKAYLNFGSKALDPSMGFWVNHP